MNFRIYISLEESELIDCFVKEVLQIIHNFRTPLLQCMDVVCRLITMQSGVLMFCPRLCFFENHVKTMLN